MSSSSTTTRAADIAVAPPATASSSSSSSRSAADAPAATTTTLTVQEKWDHAIENFVRKTTIGFAAGVLPALLLARSLPARCAVVALCCGVGSGMAYSEAHYLFDRNVLFDKRHLVYVQTARSALATTMAMTPPPPSSSSTAAAAMTASSNNSSGDHHDDTVTST